MIIHMLFSLFLYLSIKSVASHDGISYLTENFFANLEANLKDRKLDESSRKFIDRQVDNYVKLIKNSYNRIDVEEPRKRRNVDDPWNKIPTHNGVYHVNTLIPLHSIPTKFAVDIMLFQHYKNDEQQWYAAVLEGGKNSSLVISKYNGSDFNQIKSESVKDGVRLGLHTIRNNTYIVVAENTTMSNSITDKSAIYLFSEDETLEKIQNFDVDYASDVAIWSDKDDIFMAVAKGMSKMDDKVVYNVNSVVYKWLGGHFDIVQRVKTSAALRAVPFVIGKSHFLAFANSRNDLGMPETYSEIYKYDLQTEQFISYQKILTHGASDIKVFCFKSGNHREYFLVIANTFSADSDGRPNYNSSSIIYKYVDKYFIPFQNFALNAVTDWLPVIGTNGEFALFAACKFEGLKIFQYDGWKFVESKTQFTDDAFGPGITSMNLYVFNNNPVVAVSNQNDKGGMFNLYEVSFKFQNDLKNYYDDTLVWCKNSLMEMKSKTYENSARKARALADQSNNIDPIVGQVFVPTQNGIQELETRIGIQTQQMQTIENTLFQIKLSSDINIVPGRINADTIIFNSDSFFDSLTAKTINDQLVVDFLNNVITLNQNYQLENLELTTATFAHSANPKFINQHDVNDVLRKDQYLQLENLIVNGNVEFKNQLVTKEVNALNITKESVLLKYGDQTLEGRLILGNIEAEKMQAKFLNKLVLNATALSSKTIKLADIETLNVKSLIVGGFMNEIDILILDKYSLRRNGNQKISSTYVFEELHANNVDTKILNERRIPEDLVRIDEGEYSIAQDVQFMNDLIGNKVEVMDRLNQINVYSGKMDVLLHNNTEEQVVSGLKSFDRVELLKSLEVRGKFHSNRVDEMNPVVRINDDLELFGDYVVNGNVIIEAQISANNFNATKSGFSIKRMLEKGLKITEKDIPLKLDFEQQLNVHEIFVDTINNVSPRQWVVNGLNEPQYIKGWKLFEGDLHITGPTNIMHVNGINLQELEANVLKIEGTQIITGKHYVDDLNPDRLKAKNIKFGPHPWETIITNDAEQKIVGKASMKSLKSNILEVNNLNVSGLINNIKFNDMIADSVFKNSTNKITGLKNFDNIFIDNLTSRRSLKTNKIPLLIKKAEAVATVPNFIKLPDNLAIQNITFIDAINGMSALDFDANWLKPGSEQHIAGDQFIKRMIVAGNLFVESNRINGVNLTEMKDNTVKINEEHAFGTVEFKNGLVSLDKIELFGHIEGLDIDNIVADTGAEIIIRDTLIFNETVTIDGVLYVKGLINGRGNITELCNFANPDINEKRKNIVIDGNAMFVKGPSVQTINNQNVAELFETAWISNKATTLTGHANFQDAFFENYLTVKGLIEEESLKLLQDNYFSKSKNQTITAHLIFQEGIYFNSSLHAPKANVKGELCEINLDAFLSSSILQDFDQVFEDVLFVEECNINSVDGEFTVNSLNLQTDVMRYDVPNLVTGKKILEDLDVQLFKLERNINVQNIDLLRWLQSAILKTGSFNVAAQMVFNNATSFSNGIGLQGLINEKPFDAESVMLKSVPQPISNKTFISTSDQPVAFKDVKLRGFLNDLNIAKLIQNQVYLNQDATINTQLNFNADIKVHNVNFNGMYHGVNISGLLNNLTNQVSLNNYYTNYDELLKVTKKIRTSLDMQANFLHHFQTMKIFYADEMFPIEHYHEGFHLVALQRQNFTSRIDFLNFNQEYQEFTVDPELYEVMIHNIITYVSPLEYNDTSLLYSEQIQNDGSLSAHILLKYDLEQVMKIESNGTKFVLAITLPEIGTKCFLRAQINEVFMDIFCFDLDQTKINIHQKIKSGNAFVAKLIEIDNCPYIITINEVDRNRGSCITIWKYDVHTTFFNEHQHIYIASPNSISTMTHNGIHYLAIGSGQLSTTLYPGQVDIKRFDKRTQHFVEWQQFSIRAPIQVEFAVLPSNEFVLYILCNWPTESLVMYNYEGISKFTMKTTISSLRTTYSITPFTYMNDHYILAKSDIGVVIVKAVFKGF